MPSQPDDLFYRNARRRQGDHGDPFDHPQFYAGTVDVFGLGGGREQRWYARPGHTRRECEWQHQRRRLYFGRLLRPQRRAQSRHHLRAEDPHFAIRCPVWRAGPEHGPDNQERREGFPRRRLGVRAQRYLQRQYVFSQRDRTIKAGSEAESVRRDDRWTRGQEQAVLLQLLSGNPAGERDRHYFHVGSYSAAAHHGPFGFHASRGVLPR